MKIKAKYRRTLEGYLEWIPSGSIFLAPSLVPTDANAPSAAECMKVWESEGVDPVACSEPELLQRYMQGKRSRDWHISEWREGVKARLFIAEEFVGSLGLNRDNFSAIFGREINEELLQAVSTL